MHNALYFPKHLAGITTCFIPVDVLYAPYIHIHINDILKPIYILIMRSKQFQSKFDKVIIQLAKVTSTFKCCIILRA